MIKYNRIGEVYCFKNGSTMKIIKYINSDNIDIEFNDGTVVKNMQYDKFKKGKIKNNNNLKVYNTGFLGYGYYSILNDRKCYSVWSSLLERCYNEKTQLKQPSYKGCTVVDEWHNFQNFAKWFYENYIEGYHLDKDILIKGNKIYGPDNCRFVPQEINNCVMGLFIINRKNTIGVVERKNRYIAQIKFNNKMKYLGMFKTKIEAFNCYKENKEKQLKEKANEYFNFITLDVYNSLMNWEISIND